MQIHLDRVPIAPLIQKYGKTKFYTQYLKDLGITPIRDGSNSYITPEQEELIAEYHRVRGEGKDAVQAFLAEVERSRQSSELSTQSSLERSEQRLGLSEPDRLWLLVEALASRLQPTPPDPLHPQRQLEEIADRGWVVTSSQLREILGTQPREGERLGFRLVKVGRSGREAAWRVELTK